MDEDGSVTGAPTSGNPIRYYNGTPWSFSWAEGRNLKTASASTPERDIALDFAYDADGLRIEKHVTKTLYELTADHTYTDTVVAPTCTEAGYTLHECECGDSYTDSEVAALGHHFLRASDGNVVCTRCGAVHQHSYANTTVAPTCTEGGCTLHECECGDSYTDSEVAALGHDYVETETDVFTCTRCGSSYRQHTHRYTSVTVVAPTCTEAGYTLHECECGDSYQDTPVEALGHDYTATVVAPTCTEAGYTLHSCTRCEDSYHDAATEALGHSYGRRTVVPPTCTAMGYTLRTCSRCGEKQKTNFKNALGHDYQKEPETGLLICTRCGMEGGGSVTPPSSSYDVMSLDEPTEPVDTAQALHRGAATEVEETHRYIYAGGKLLRETISEGSTTTTLDFTYDNAGMPYSLICNNGTMMATYYYITNLQGDVMYLVDSDGVQVAAYDYDPYGKIISATGAMAEINPLRYRGYYYDSETGFYYLQSRYYDPEICRFINADSYASTGQSYLGYNMFAYCQNNPIAFADYNGEWIHLVIGAAVGTVIGVVGALASGGNAIDVAIAGVAGGLSGLLAASGVGAVGQVIGGAAIAMASNAGQQVNHLYITKDPDKDHFDVGDMLFDGVVSGVSAAIGGAGASFGNTGGIGSAGKQLISKATKGTLTKAALKYYASQAHKAGGEFVLKALSKSFVYSAVSSAICTIKTRLKESRLLESIF